MLFEPYEDELNYIAKIHKYNSKDYTIIRLTDTMLNKGIIDANVFVRDVLKKYGVFDFSTLNNGEKELIKVQFIGKRASFEAKMSCYKAKTRGDERFWVYGKEFRGQVKSGHLIYITVAPETYKVIIINLSVERIDEIRLSTVFGADKINESLTRLVPGIKQIASQGYHLNFKGAGKIAPKDAGDTLEALLGIKTNNQKSADFEGVIELKSKISKTLDTLFTLRPQFDGTPIADFEPNDRSRVSAFARYYGYESDKHPDMCSLYITIGSEYAPQNNQGFYLEVNENDRTVEIRKIENSGSHKAGYWNFDDLENELHLKHPATLWVKAESRMNGNIGEFKYVEAELTRSPQFMTFISLIKSGEVTYDWRGYTTKDGKYSGKNHGNAWRVKKKQRNKLFGSSEIIDLL
ncbi:MvaI/BcnI family restriction endonuclease [Streptococcus pluranimalium]|uniref:MvaI/BcnI family restriction endonuclease n=1 Tax=Streptococcus hyovaginalis TaxID=149015 RepID=UPI001478F3C3|nr:MvaI/BcnI family restriction endonuclease [Streptococcus hyovaginalis]